MGLSPTYPLLLLAALLAGLALATGNPVTNKLVIERIDHARRGMTMGLKQAGVQAGAFLSGLVLAPAAAVWGWRAALAATATVPLVGAVGTVLAVPRDVAVARGQRRAQRMPVSAPVRRLAVYGFLMGVAVSNVNAYLPLFAVEDVGMSTVRAGALIGVMGIFGMTMRVVWAWSSDRSGRYGRYLTWMAFGGMVSILLGVVTAVAGLSPHVLWLTAIGLGFSAVTWLSVAMIAVVASARPQNAGHASGVVLFGFYSGFLPGPVLFGWIVDTTGTYTASWSLVIAMFLAAGALMSRPWPQYDPPTTAGD
jgi:MFS family permease